MVFLHTVCILLLAAVLPALTVTAKHSLAERRSGASNSSIPLDGSQTPGRNCTVDSSHVATLSDCQTLLSNLTSFTAGYNATEATCAYITGRGYIHTHRSRTIARKGNCALAYASPVKEKTFAVNETHVLQQAKPILQCGANAGPDMISARKVFKDGHALCLLEGDATCGCFDRLLMTPFGPPTV